MDDSLDALREEAVKKFPNGVLVVYDSNLVYQLIGPDVLPFSKRKAVDMVGKSVQELFGEDTAAELEPRLRATLEGEAQSFDIMYSGRIHHIETQPTEIDGEPYGVLVTQNVTKERRTTEQLEVLNRIVRHDIRNDMSIMLGWAELLEEHLDESGTEPLARILNSGAHILDLTTDLRDIVEVLVSDGEMKLHPVSVRETLETEVILRRESFPNAKFTIRDSCGEMWVMANELLSSVFRNLLNNAVQHNDKDAPIIEVSCERTNGEVYIYVADNGPGITAAKKETFFVKEQRGIDSEGTGMGLYLVEKLIRQFNGQIWADDNDPEGTVFTIKLPVTDHDPNPR